MSVNVIPLAVKDAYIVEFSRFKDQRGWLEEIYNEEKYPEAIAQFFPVRQNTVSMSRKNVIRGLHISTYCKLLSCVRGAVYDVVVDVRPTSPTYLQWAGVKLTADNCRQLFIPPDCGHGYMALEEENTVIYCQGGCFNPAKLSDRGISPFDPLINIKWPLPEGISPIVSDKDRNTANLQLPPGITIQPRRRSILVIGASGQVGGALIEALHARSDEYVTLGTYNANAQPGMMPFDMQKAAHDPTYVDVLLETCYPDVIIICAAFSWVDGNQLHRQKAEEINVFACEAIARSAQKINAKIVFYSSDYVFDGESGDDSLNTEDTVAKPVNAYGEFKLRTEESLQAIQNNSLIIRISRVYGPDEHGKNFVYQVRRCGKEGKTLNCLHDEVSCCTYNRDVAQATLRLLEEEQCGVFHCAGPSPQSKYAWGMQVAKYFNLDPSFLVKITQDDAKSAAKRPKNCALGTAKIRRVLPNLTLHSMEEAFADWRKHPRGEVIQWPKVDQ